MNYVAAENLGSNVNMVRDMKSYKKLAIGIVALLSLSAPVFAACETTPSVSVDGGNHEYGAPEFIWDEETEGKCTAVFTCTLCKEQMEVEAAVSSEKVSSATCLEGGYVTYKASVRNAGRPYSEEKTYKTEDALGHLYDLSTESSVKWSWKEAEEGFTATLSLRCTRCYDQSNPTVTVTPEETPISKDVDGCMTYTAEATSADGQKFTSTKVIAYEHSYTDPTENDWIITNGECILSLKCKDEDCPRVLTIPTTKSTTATCTQDGINTYTATYDINGVTKTYSYTDPESAPALGHDFSDASYVAEVEATCLSAGVMAHYECSRCGALFDTDKNEKEGIDSFTIAQLDHSYVKADTVAPNYDYDGGVVYTCTMCGESKLETDDNYSKLTFSMPYDKEKNVTLNPYMGNVYYEDGDYIGEDGLPDMANAKEITPIHGESGVNYYSYGGDFLSETKFLEKYGSALYSYNGEFVTKDEGGTLLGNTISRLAIVLSSSTSSSATAANSSGYYTFTVTNEETSGKYFMNITEYRASVATVTLGNMGDTVQEKRVYISYYYGTSTSTVNALSVYVEAQECKTTSFTFKVSDFEYVKLGGASSPVTFENTDHKAAETVSQLDDNGVAASNIYETKLLAKNTSEEDEEASIFYKEIYVSISRAYSKTSVTESWSDFNYTYLYVTAGVELYCFDDNGDLVKVESGSGTAVRYSGTNISVLMQATQTYSSFDRYIVPLYVETPITFCIKNAEEDDITLQMFTVKECILSDNKISEKDTAYTFELTQDDLKYGYLLQFPTVSYSDPDREDKAVWGNIEISVTDSNGNALDYDVYVAGNNSYPPDRERIDSIDIDYSLSSWYAWILSDATFEGTITVTITISST